MRTIRGNVVSCLALVMVLLGARLALGENVCPPLNPPKGKDDRRMEEKAFTAKEFAEALSYFSEELPKELSKAEKTTDFLDGEGFRIGYPNVIKTMEGYALRQEALLRRAERDLVIERGLRGRASKQDVAAAKARFEEAKRRFCSYLENALYTD